MLALNSDDRSDEPQSELGCGPISKLFQTFESTMSGLKDKTEKLTNQKITKEKELSKYKENIVVLKKKLEELKNKK